MHVGQSDRQRISQTYEGVEEQVGGGQQPLVNSSSCLQVLLPDLSQL